MITDFAIQNKSMFVTEILSKLDAQSLESFWQTTHLLDDDEVWHLLCAEKFHDKKEEEITWYQYYTRHPIAESEDGSRIYVEHGVLHRYDEPAVILGPNPSDEVKEVLGELYDGFVTFPMKMWFRYGRLHRDGDLPAVVSAVEDGRDYNYHLEWYIDGILHRDNGPACITTNGDSYDNIDVYKWYHMGVIRLVIHGGVRKHREKYSKDKYVGGILTTTELTDNPEIHYVHHLQELEEFVEDPLFMDTL